MSIASELSALNGYILGAYDEINDKGGTVPANKNMANLASAIASISGGGGGSDPNLSSGQLIIPSGWSSGTNLTIQHGLSHLPTLFFMIYNVYFFGGVRLFVYGYNGAGTQSGYEKTSLSLSGNPSAIVHGDSLADSVTYVNMQSLSDITISGSLASIIGSNYINNYKAYWWAMYDDRNFLAI